MISSCRLRPLLNWGRAYLKQAGIESAWIDARLLLAHTLSCSPEQLMALDDQKVTWDQVSAYQHTISRRQHHEPVSRIVKYREFWSLSFEISPATLDPRPETELLVETVLKKFTNRHQAWRILDLGTGSGCILLSLLQEYPEALGLGIDICFDALKVARKNAEKLHLHHRTLWQQGHWHQGIQASFDIIVSNPPYIPHNQISGLSNDVKQYDPRQALEGGEDGLLCYRQLAHQLKSLCHQDTQIYFEIGQGQQDDVTDIMKRAGLQLVMWCPDLAGILRCGVFKILSS